MRLLHHIHRGCLSNLTHRLPAEECPWQRLEAGPGGGDAVRPVGTVYLGAARGDRVYVKKLFVSRPDRALIRARAAQTALEMALRLAQGKTPAGTQVLAESAQHDPAALTALDETLREE